MTDVDPEVLIYDLVEDLSAVELDEAVDTLVDAPKLNRESTAIIRVRQRQNPTLADWEAAVTNVDDDAENWGELIEGDRLRTMLEEAQDSILRQLRARAG
jgi:hypothetical protein